MPRTPRTTRRALVTALAAAGALTALLTGPSAVAADRPGTTTAAERAEATAALDAAQESLQGAPAAEEAPTRDTTLALRDLALTYRDLTGTQRAEAKQLLDPPATAQVTCNAEICVHYTPPGTTPNADASTATQAALALSTMTDIRAKYLAAGYRAPRSDGTRGGDGRFDVYLEDTGAQRVYGYCNTFSDVTIPDRGPYDVPAYCVLDNDFKKSQFPTNTPQENLEVTAAHEYFHAVQFAYDFTEDRWMLEATATWAEDELYNDVNDNRQYLADSPLKTPSTPLDTFSNSTGFQYGTWIFFRYLTERFPTADGGLPVLVRKIFEQADGAAGGPDKYSLEAVRSALAAQTGQSLPTVFAEFADANLRPTSTYREAVAGKYPSAQLKSTKTLSSKTRSSGTVRLTVKHLTSSTARFKPSKTTSKWRLKLSVYLDETRPGAAAVVTSVSKSGVATTRLVPLNASANGSTVVGFAASNVSYVDLTLVNFGGRYTCWEGTDFSCQGTPRDDKTAASYKATALPK